MARQVLENGVILPAEYSDDWYDDMTSNLTKLDDVIGSDSEKLSSADVGAAALSNNYNDLDNLPTIPTVNDATLTIQKNGVDVQTFTANASSNVTCNITVPTKTSDLTNDSNFVDTSNSAVASGITSAKVTDYDAHIADADIHVTSSDKTTWNTVTSKAQDSDVVHKSGNETIAGKKTFSDDLTLYNYDSSQSTKNLNIASSKIQVGDTSNSDAFGIRFNAGASYVAQILAVNDITGTQNLQLSLRTKDSSNNLITSMVRSRLSANGNSSFEAGANDSISLGSSSSKWKSVYATNYYYGSNNVEFSNKFVTTDTAQTITSNKTFVGSQYFKDNNVQYFGIDFSKGTAPSGYTARCTYFSPLTGGGSTYQTSNGLIGCAVSTDNVVTTFMHAIKNTANATTRTSFVLYYDTDNDKRSVTTNGDFLPMLTGQGIGNSTSKWSTINGLEPSSLGMPDLANGIDISSYITHLDKVVNNYTPPSNGWLSIRVKKTSLAHTSLMMYQTGGLLSSFETAEFSISGANLPVIANKNVEIYIIADSLASAKFYPCLGNV